MPIVLTDEQVLQIDAGAGHPMEVIAPRTGQRYTLVPSDEYAALKERVEQDIPTGTSARNSARRLAKDE